MNSTTFTPESLLALLRALFWCGVFMCAGLAAWRWLEPRSKARVPWSLCFALGCGIAVPFAVGGAVFHSPVAGVSALLIIVIFVGLAGFNRRGVPRFVGRQKSKSGYLFFGAILPLLFALPVLIRPHLNYDVLSYHLPIAHFLSESGLDYLPGNYYSRLPLAAFALYAPMLSDWGTTFDDAGVRVILLCAMFTGGFLCARIAGQLRIRKVGQAVAALLYVFHPMTWDAYYQAHSDLLAAMFALAAFERMLSDLGAHKLRKGLVAGYLGGIAVGVKFSAVGIVAIPLLLLAVSRRQNSLRRAGAVIGGIILGYLPWGLRGLVLAGNPLHPFAGESDGWTAEQAAFLLEQHRPLSVFSADYWSAFVGKLKVFDFLSSGTPVSLLLISALLFVVVRRKGKPAVLLAAAIAGYCAWLTVGLAPARFMLPVVGLFCAMAGGVFAPLPQFKHQVQIIIQVCFAALFMMSILTGFRDQYMSGFYPEAWRQGAIPEAILESARREESGGETLLFFEARTRWFPEGTAPHDVWSIPPWANDLKHSENAVEFAARLRAQGYRQVFVNEYELGRLIDFYGGHEFENGWGSVGVMMDEDDYVGLVKDWPPGRFAGLEERDFRVLREFFTMSQRRATEAAAAGPMARLWLSPL